MFLPKILSVLLLFATVHSRYVYFIDPADLEGSYEQDSFENANFEPVVPMHVRVARQAPGSEPVNLSGSIPLAGNDDTKLSAIGSVSGYHLDGPKRGQYDAVSGGLGLEHVNGHSLSVTGTHLPSFGDQLTAAGKMNVLHTDNHDLNANAFVSRSFPSNPAIPDFTTRGAGLDYMYKDKVGGSLGIAQTPLFQRTDYSASANMNLFKDRSSSLDLNAGMSRSVSPFIPKSSWEPNFGLTYRRSW